MPNTIHLPIGPGAARQLLKVVKATHREVNERLSQLEALLQEAAGESATPSRRATKKRARR